MDYRVTLTYTGDLGEDRADKLLDALLADSRAGGPVLGEGPGSFEVVLVVPATSLPMAVLAASDIVGPTLESAIGHRGLSTAASVELVDEHAPAHAA